MRFLSSRYVNRGKKAWQWRAVTAALWGRRLSGQRAISLLTCTRRLPGQGPHRTANLIFTVEMVLSPRLALAWTHTGSCRIPPESMYCQNIKPVVKCPCAFSWFMSYRAVSLGRLCEWRLFSHLALHISTLFNLFFRLFIFFFARETAPTQVPLQRLSCATFKICLHGRFQLAPVAKRVTRWDSFSCLNMFICNREN